MYSVFIALDKIPSPRFVASIPFSRLREKVPEGRMRVSFQVKNPHPAFGHPLPCCARERGKVVSAWPSRRADPC